MTEARLANANVPKRLCELGLCVSMSEGRRLVQQMPSKRLTQVISKREEELRKAGDPRAPRKD